MKRPEPGEYDEFFAEYINLISSDNIVEVLKEQHKDTQNFIASLSEEQGNSAYSDGKWTIKEILGHIIDTERVMIYRALCFARGEGRDLPDLDPQLWVKNAHFNNRTLEDLMHKFRMLRVANIAFYETLDDESIGRVGRADGKLIGVQSLFYYIAGHERHHIDFIRNNYL